VAMIGVVTVGSATATAGTAGAAVRAASGTPIQLGYITSPEYLSYAPQGAEAAIKAINAAGGIHGHPLQLVTCSNQDNANAAAACARQFASNPSIVATVGDVSSYGSSTNPPLQAAHIAGVGTAPLGSGDFSAQRVFANNPGGLCFLALAEFAADNLKAKSIGMVGIDSPTAQALPTLINQVALAPRHTKIGAVASVPITGGASLSTQAAALGGSDAQLIALSANSEIQYIEASRQQGYKGPFLVYVGTASAKQLQQALPASDLKDIYAVSYFNQDSEGYTHYLANLKKYEKQVQPGDLSVVSWLGVETFAAVAKTLPNITRTGVYNAMTHLTNSSTGGLTAKPLSYTTPGTALGGTAPRVVPAVQYSFIDKYKNGEFVPISTPQTPVALFGAPPSTGSGG
jgi:ABC-type branched-subunit amino acid transport system substrate-binding protein